MKKEGASKKGGAAKKRDAAKRGDAAKDGDSAKKVDASEKDGPAAGGVPASGGSGATLLPELKGLTDGLMFQSESDYPVEPFEEKAAGAASSRDFVAAKTGAGADVRELDFDAFFKTSTEEQDWQDEEARARVRKFQALVKFLKERLTDVKVYRAGETEADVYAVGKTDSGDFAGVKTKVVET